MRSMFKSSPIGIGRPARRRCGRGPSSIGRARRSLLTARRLIPLLANMIDTKIVRSVIAFELGGSRGVLLRLGKRRDSPPSRRFRVEDRFVLVSSDQMIALRPRIPPRRRDRVEAERAEPRRQHQAYCRLATVSIRDLSASVIRYGRRLWREVVDRSPAGPDDLKQSRRSASRLVRAHIRQPLRRSIEQMRTRRELPNFRRRTASSPEHAHRPGVVRCSQVDRSLRSILLGVRRVQPGDQRRRSHRVRQFAFARRAVSTVRRRCVRGSASCLRLAARMITSELRACLRASRKMSQRLCSSLRTASMIVSQKP